MISSSKCDFSVIENESVRTTAPVVVTSAKCDFSLLGDGVSFVRTGGRTVSRVDLAEGLGSIRSASSKCDFRLSVEDARDRFSLSARVAGSSKCDFSLMVDLTVNGGETIRAVAGGSSKCDFVLSRLDKVSNPDPT